jgi:hypothetical protein
MKNKFVKTKKMFLLCRNENEKRQNNDFRKVQAEPQGRKQRSI